MELWEVLDGEGNPTGEIMEKYDKKVFERGFYHLGSDVWIINSDNKILIQKRSKLKKLEPNVWAMTGGSVILGESSLETIVREAKEELDIDIDSDNLKLITKFRTGNVWIDTYILKYDYDISKMRFQEDEVSDAKWATWKEIEELVNNGQFIKNRWEFVSKILKAEIDKGTNKNNLFKLTDKDFGIEPQDMDNCRLRLSARGIVIREDGKIALQNKSKKNEFKLVGGGIENNEDPIIAFQREVLEEAGCEIKIIRQLGTTEEYKSLQNLKQISHIFIAKVINDLHKLSLTEKEKNEGAKLLWVEPKEALELVTDCYNKLLPSDYDDVYDTRFVVLRDRKILEYYLENIK